MIGFTELLICGVGMLLPTLVVIAAAIYSAFRQEKG